LSQSILSSAQTGQALSALKSSLVLEQATDSLRAGNPSDAEWTLRRHLLEAPEDAAVLAKLAELVLGRNQIDEATILLRRAASSDPSRERQMTLIRHLQKHVGALQVLSEIEALPADMRNEFDVLAIESAMYGFLGQHDRQIAIHERLAALKPNDPGLWMARGEVLRMVGRIDEARAAVRKAIKLRPDFGEAWWTLANSKSFRFTDADISAMRRALRRKLSDADALQFHFALGKALEDRKEFAKSFQHYAAGNAIRRAQQSPGSMRVTNYIEGAIATFTPDFFEKRNSVGSTRSGPIFVLGLHRSGSTLIEQILASHPQIEGTTEITIVHQMWQRLERLAARSGRTALQEMQRLAASDFAAIAEEYLERAAAFRSTDKPYFIDKMPANWMYLGLIRLALPNAKIIDARRHPMACGFSNFKQNYASGISFSYSLESIGIFYRDYWRFMRHLDRVLPGFIHRVINERLIEDPETEIRSLLEFVGVPFDPACLEFHKNKRAVRTPSAEQVRRGINRDGVDQWRNYEPWLGPLKGALGEALENWDKV
jgi:tetratricopeptide (TPR) repeat protein